MYVTPKVPDKCAHSHLIFSISRPFSASRVFLRPRGTFDAVLLEEMEVISRAESFVCVAAYF